MVNTHALDDDGLEYLEAGCLSALDLDSRKRMCQEEVVNRGLGEVC